MIAEALRDTNGPVLVVTGAGISLASGIPTFRGTDPGAVWKRDVTELGTNRYFEEEPEGSWSWYLSRFEKLLDAKPNAGHHALVAIERSLAARGVPFLLVTQNIDGLHAAAGSKELVEVHGSARKVRCSDYGCENGAPRGSLERASVDMTAFCAEPTRANVPTCPACGSLLRQHVLWFDELYNGHADYQWDRVLRAAETAKVVVFVGTSFSVGVTGHVVDTGIGTGAKMFSIDPGGMKVRGVTTIAAPAETLLPEIAAALAA